MSGRHRIGTRFIVATMLVGLGLTAPTLVRAAATVDLDQWASTDRAWQNGNLNGNNSRYPEGGIVPFRLAMEGLKAGNHAIHINYDFTAGGHKAYDFLATWNVTNAAGKACTPSGGAISSMCPSLPASSSAAIPSDPFKANGLSVSGAEHYSGSPRRLTIWGGTITSISRPPRGQRQRQQHRRHPRPLPLDGVGRPPGMGRPPRPVPVLGHRRRRRARWRLARVRGAVAYAHAPARWSRQQEPGSQHPAERDRR